jgi:putative phosphotransacetylase
MAKFIVETSARHIHVSKETLKYLFGDDFELVCRKELSQPGQYVSTSRLDVVGPKKTIPGVSILGPTRDADQVEVSLTDSRTLGVSAPIRESGDTANSAPIILRNPENGKEVSIKEGLIIAKRHIHMTTKDAEVFGVKNGEIVNVLVNTPDRKTIFGDVVVRVKDSFGLAMHIDTDEANAAACAGEVYGEIYR